MSASARSSGGGMGRGRGHSGSDRSDNEYISDGGFHSSREDHAAGPGGYPRGPATVQMPFIATDHHYDGKRAAWCACRA